MYTCTNEISCCLLKQSFYHYLFVVVLLNTFVNNNLVTMGVQGQNQTLFLSEKIDFTHLIGILCEIHDRHSKTAHADGVESILKNYMDRQPCVVLDANQVGMKMSKSAGSPMLRISGLTRLFMANGIDVIIAADGVSRPHTKRASFKRAADRELARIAALKAKKEMANIAIANNPQKRQELQKLIKSKENRAFSLLPAEFIKVLKSQVEYLNDLGLPGHVTMKVAKGQADLMIARLVIHGLAEAIISTDSDFADEWKRKW